MAEIIEKDEWKNGDLQTLAEAIIEELKFSEELSRDETEIYALQDKIYSLNEQRNVRALELSNLDRKINFVVQSQLQKNQKKGENDTFVFFDQSASQDNPLGDHKSDYAGFLYLLRVEPQYLAKAVMEIPFAEMDYMVQCLNFSLFPDLFQAREELYLLDLIKHIINNQVELAADPTDVLRQNSFVTKLLSGYTKRHFGQVHLVLALKDAVLFFMEEVNESPTALEMNPDFIYKQLAGDNYDNTLPKEEIMKIKQVSDQIEINRQKLEDYSIKVLEGIVNNLPSMPYGLRYVCKQLILLAGRKFDLTEKQMFLMVSSFLILRYFNPALLCPDVFGIIDREISNSVRRPFVLLSKVIQNYANDMLFGGKESYMQPFNESRQKGIEILKAYCKQAIEVPEPQEYYATVANLPTRKDVRHSIFHNTCVTISPNQLYTIHRLMATHQEKLIPKFHPLSFFLKRLGEVPSNVERKDDKIFTMPLSGGDDEEVDEETKLELELRNMSEACATALQVFEFKEREELCWKNNQDLIDFFHRNVQNLSEEKQSIVKKAISALATLKKKPETNVLYEIERYLVYRRAYRKSLEKEKEEMKKSLQTLMAEAHEATEKETLYQNYFQNIIKSAFILKLQSRKDYQESKQIGPLEYSCNALERLGCIANVKDIEPSIRKSTVFSFSCVEPGRIEVSITNTSTKDNKTVFVGISALLDLLTQQDTAKIYSFVFDLRTFIAFLASEIAG